MNRWEIAPELGMEHPIGSGTVRCGRCTPPGQWQVRVGVYAYINKKKLKILLATVY